MRDLPGRRRITSERSEPGPGLLRHPAMTIKSARVSSSFASARIGDFPVLASPRSEISRAPDATVRLGGRLFVGMPPNRGGGLEHAAPAQQQRTILRVGPRGGLVTKGWVLLGPGVQAIVGADAELIVGGGTYVTANSQILVSERVEIGWDCAISFGVTVLDTDWHDVRISGRPRLQRAPVRIGDHVWIGTGVTVLKGVTIGDGAVIGAGSVVTADVPPKCLAGGVPARVVDDDVEWE